LPEHVPEQQFALTVHGSPVAMQVQMPVAHFPPQHWASMEQGWPSA
jgi:hypothetical protein